MLLEKQQRRKESKEFVRLQAAGEAMVQEAEYSDLPEDCQGVSEHKEMGIFPGSEEMQEKAQASFWMGSLFDTADATSCRKRGKFQLFR